MEADAKTNATVAKKVLNTLGKVYVKSLTAKKNLVRKRTQEKRNFLYETNAIIGTQKRLR